MASHLLPYLYQKLQSEELTPEQYQICLDTCLESHESQVWEACLIQFNLLNDFNRHMREQSFKKNQQLIISGRIKELNQKITELSDQLVRTQQKLDPEVKNQLEYWQDRSRLFPDNPRFQTEVQKCQKLIADHQASCKPLEFDLEQLKLKKEKLFQTVESLIPPIQ